MLTALQGMSRSLTSTSTRCSTNQLRLATTRTSGIPMVTGPSQVLMGSISGSTSPTTIQIILASSTTRISVLEVTEELNSWLTKTMLKSLSMMHILWMLLLQPSGTTTRGCTSSTRITKASRSITTLSGFGEGRTEPGTSTMTTMMSTSSTVSDCLVVIFIVISILLSFFLLTL